MEKDNNISSGKLYYKIGEVADMFNVNTSLIRFWSNEFDILKLKTNQKGNRLYTQTDIDNIKMIWHLVKERGMTLAGAKKKLKESSSDLQSNFEIISKLQEIRGLLLDIRSEL